MAKTKKQSSVNTPFFGRQNYIWMLVGLVILGIGFFLMAGGKSSDPKVFNTAEVYSFTRITLAPVLIILGFLIEIYAIMKSPAGPASE